MIGECISIRNWKDMNGVNPRIGDYVLQNNAYRLRVYKIVGTSNTCNSLGILVKEENCTSLSKLHKQEFSNSEIISKFHPKYKEIK